MAVRLCNDVYTMVHVRLFLQIEPNLIVALGGSCIILLTVLWEGYTMCICPNMFGP